jgi:Glycosidases
MLNKSSINTKKTGPVSNDKWWKGGVIYQVYPRSYQDSNGDGIGDLVGITKRLSYIASLGVDAVWISPFFKSPMKDYGYDVSDYLEIDPMFGTMDDFDTVLAEAHNLGLRLMIDLVLSHTSDSHAWFNESRSDHTNSKMIGMCGLTPNQMGHHPITGYQYLVDLHGSGIAVGSSTIYTTFSAANQT